MRRVGLSTDDKGGGAASGLEVRGGGLTKRINQSVGPPVGGGEARAVPLLGFTTGRVGFVRKHPHELPLVTKGVTLFQILARGASSGGSRWRCPHWLR